MTENMQQESNVVAQLARNIPPEAWEQFVDTACTVFRKFLAPITATTSGVGRLIEAKFNNLVDAEKILAADTIRKALEKVEVSGKKPKGQYENQIIQSVIEESVKQTDEIMRELWANLLAQEIIEGEIHPEFPRILSRLTSGDAKLLAKLVEQNSSGSNIYASIIRSVSKRHETPDYAPRYPKKPDSTLHHEVLKSLNLIGEENGGWVVTLLGKEFVKIVTDPSIENEEKEN